MSSHHIPTLNYITHYTVESGVPLDRNVPTVTVFLKYKLNRSEKQQGSKVTIDLNHCWCKYRAHKDRWVCCLLYCVYSLESISVFVKT